MKKASILISFLLFTISSFAQETDWYVNFYNIMDNREYKHTIGYPQTIMGARLDVAGGLKQDSTSGVYFGINYMYEYGSTLDSIPPTLNLYYTINRKDLECYIGSFPKEKVQHFPKFMFSDSLNYYTPNIGGMAFDFKRNWGNLCLFVDWTGRQSQTRRESFVAGMSGTYKKDIFYTEGYCYMYHYALSLGNRANENIEDNGAGALFFGANLSEKTALDILKCDLGPIGNYDRVRPGNFNINGGVMGRLNAYYKRFGVDITSYWGSNMKVLQGDQLYKNGSYTRTDLCFIPIKGKYVESVFKWCYHFTGGEICTSQQLFLVARF